MTPAEKRRASVLRREIEQAARSFEANQRDASIAAAARTGRGKPTSDRAHYVLGYLLAGADISSSQFDEWSGLSSTFGCKALAPISESEMQRRRLLVANAPRLAAPACEHTHCIERTDGAHALCPFCSDAADFCDHCGDGAVVCDCLECENRARALRSHEESRFMSWVACIKCGHSAAHHYEPTRGPGPCLGTERSGPCPCTAFQAPRGTADDPQYQRTMKAADECAAILRPLAQNERAYAIATTIAEFIEEDPAIVDKIGHLMLRGAPHN